MQGAYYFNTISLIMPAPTSTATVSFSLPTSVRSMKRELEKIARRIVRRPGERSLPNSGGSILVTYGGGAARHPSIGRNQNSHSVRSHYRTYSIRFDVAGCRRGVSHGINGDIARKLAVISSAKETNPTPMPPFPCHRTDATTDFFGLSLPVNLPL